MNQINFQEYIDKIPFRSVKQSIDKTQMAWVRVHKWAIALFLVCTVVYLYILLAYHLDGRLFALPVAVIVLYYVKFANEGESDFYKSVAGAWGWDYFPALLPKDFPSSFLVHGKKGVAIHVLRSKSLPRVGQYFYTRAVCVNGNIVL